MTERTSGLRTLLSGPAVYEAFQVALGARRSRRLLAERHIRASPGSLVLDIGCGPGDILDALPPVIYVGLDSNPRYIESARRRNREDARFICADARDATIPAEGRFDLVLAIGILHHLDDKAAENLMRLAASKLSRSGRLVTFDGVFVPGQPPIARWLLNRDRGACVRTVAGYAELAGAHFGRVETTVSSDFLRVPYTHLVMQAAEPIASAL